MVGEKFEIFMSQMAQITLLIATMVGKMYEICMLEKFFKFVLLKWLKSHFELSTMVCENVEICILLIVHQAWRKF